jgi:hypothetical protein
MVKTIESRDVSALIGLLEEQRGLYGRLRLLADRQRTLIVQDDSRPLLALLAERQRLVDGLVSLNERLAPYRSEWTAVYGGLEETVRRRVAELLEEANAALGSILQSDSRDTAALTARRQGMVQQLATVDAGTRASAAYASAGTAMRSQLADAEA